MKTDGCLFTRVSCSVAFGLLLFVLVCSTAGSATQAEQEKQQNLCASNGYSDTIDSDIQSQLQNLYGDDSCYQKEAQSSGQPLDDGVVGEVTKKWINHALQTQVDEKTENAVNESAYIGIQPVILLENDLLALSLNKEVIEVLTALVQDAEKNRFLTKSEAEAGIEKELSSLKDMNDVLLANHYMPLLRPMITTVPQQTLTQTTLDALVAQGQVAAADALTGLVGQPQSSEDFKKVVANTLVQKIASDESETNAASADQDASELTTLVKKTDEEFKSKVAEIAALGEDTESLIKKLIEFSKKLNPIGKNFNALRKAKAKRKAEAEKELAALLAEGDDTTSEVDESSTYEVAKSILLTEIKKHEKSAINLKKKGKDDEADKETFIANELKNIFFDELARIEENAAIDKTNADNAQAKKDEEAAAKARAQEQAALEAASAELKNTDIMKVITELTDVQTRYKLTFSSDLSTLLPSLDADVAKCVQSLVGVSYVSQFSLKSAVNILLSYLDDVSYNMSDPETPKDIAEFACSVENAMPENYFKQTNAAAILADKALKPFNSEKLEAINLQEVPGCTHCSEPMKGLSYGFYPYWQASEQYRKAGFSSTGKELLDFSMFSNIAYFALAVNDEGKIENELHLGNQSNIASFFTTLNKYNVQRDIVIYLYHWKNWAHLKSPSSGKSTAQIINGYAKEHYDLLETLHQQFIDDGGISGITFYLDNYQATDDVSGVINYVTDFKSFMTEEQNGSKTTAFTLRLMLGLNGLVCENLKMQRLSKSGQNCNSVNVGERITENDPNYFLKLSSLFLSGNSTNGKSEGSLTNSDLSTLINGTDLFSSTKLEPPIVENILVVLNEGTSLYKKALRTQIENEFTGGARVQTLTTVVPIMGRLELTEQNEDATLKQFQDDIAYLKYNFGGMGLWNLPFTGVDDKGEAEETNAIMQVYAELLKNDYGYSNNSYLDREKIGLVGQLLLNERVSNVVDVCGEVCPKRTLFVDIFIVTLILNCLLVLLWRTNCQARVLIKRTRPVRELVLASSLLLFIALLGCHPAWQYYNSQILSVCIVLLLSNLLYRFLSSSYETSEEG